MDGARTVNVEMKGSSVFLWGRGFSYEFDKGLMLHVLAKELGLVDRSTMLLVMPEMALST